MHFFCVSFFFYFKERKEDRRADIHNGARFTRRMTQHGEFKACELKISFTNHYQKKGRKKNVVAEEIINIAAGLRQLFCQGSLHRQTQTNKQP
jgi:hypothetical protein